MQCDPSARADGSESRLSLDLDFLLDGNKRDNEKVELRFGSAAFAAPKVDELASLSRFLEGKRRDGKKRSRMILVFKGQNFSSKG